jgi:transcription initiation factor IIE alpha subunit
MIPVPHQFRVYRVIELVMNKEPFTSEDLANDLGIGKKVAQLHLKNLWMLDLMYIADWERQGTHHIPIYRWGNKPDVEQPKPEDRSVTDRRYRERQKLKQQEALD